MKTIKQNQVAEWAFESTKHYTDAFNEVAVSATFTAPNGNELFIPAFWGGGSIWKIRCASSLLGTHFFRLDCSDPENSSFKGQTGSLEVTEYDGVNTLYKHGNLQKSADGVYLQHEDGQPFFWRKASLPFRS